MAVDYQLFLNWCKGYFGEANISFARGGEEICVNSPFAEDYKHHLWMNPSGGKSSQPELGSFRCWYSDRCGSLVRLVSELEGIDWEEAQELISDQVSLRELESKVDNFFNSSITSAQNQSNVGLIDLPPYTYLIDSLGKEETYYNRAVEYLKQRKIPTTDLYICTAGDYNNRIVIPYYNKKRQLIWWNARTISKNSNTLRYMKPSADKDSGLSQENVLYMKEYPSPKAHVLIMEGEFDVLSLYYCGINAAACGGKALSDNQIDLLRPYIPVLAFDSDNPGKKALMDVGVRLLEKGFQEVYYVRAPKIYKDWNKLYVETNAATVQQYIKKYIKRFHSWTPDTLELQGL